MGMSMFNLLHDFLEWGEQQQQPLATTWLRAMVLQDCRVADWLSCEEPQISAQKLISRLRQFELNPSDWAILGGIILDHGSALCISYLSRERRLPDADDLWMRMRTYFVKGAGGFDACPHFIILSDAQTNNIQKRAS